VKLKIFQLGKTRESWLKQGCAEYIKRLGNILKLEITEIPDVSITSTPDIQTLIAKEATTCLKRIGEDDFLVLLDEQGMEKTSLEFAEFLDNLSEKKSVVFLIAGVYGAHESLKKRANATLSLSKMTFTHQMARIFLLEQIYRAQMISHGRNYHH